MNVLPSQQVVNIFFDGTITHIRSILFVMNTQTPSKYVLYLRISTAKSGGVDSNGIAAQDRDLNIFLSSQHQPEVVGRFVEVMSGANNDRPQLKQALDLCRSTGSQLVVQKVDRLSRDVEFVARLLKDKTVQLRVANIPSADHFQIHLFAALGMQEREFISIRTKAAMAAAKARGVRFGNPRINELNLPRKRKANQFDSRIWPMVKTLRSEGMSFQRIATALNDMGERRPKGNVYHPTQVKRIYDRSNSLVVA